MPEVKWIKLVTDMFDNRKIRQIETMPDADSILVIWLKLLCLAGKVNECGAIMFTPDIPYTDEMLSKEFDRPMNTVRLALTTFERFGMIELSNTVYHVSNWEKYQNIDGMERIREQTRARVTAHRERKRLECNTGNVTGNVTVTQSNATDIDIDKEREIDIPNGISVKSAIAALTAEPPLSEDKSGKIIPPVDYAEVANIFHECCPSIRPTNKLPLLTDKRKLHIRIMVNQIGRENLRRLFESAEASDFLTGRNGAWTGCAFDWLINRNNAIKVLEGNYDNKTQDKPGFRPPEPKEWN